MKKPIKKNQTKYAALDVFENDDRILLIEDEGEDGLWADLAKGYSCDGCSSLHEPTPKRLIDAARSIQQTPAH